MSPPIGALATNISDSEEHSVYLVISQNFRTSGFKSQGTTISAQGFIDKFLSGFFLDTLTTKLFVELI